MYYSKFAADMENMQTSLHNTGVEAAYIGFFLNDFDSFCRNEFPDASLLSYEIADRWIHSANSASKHHMARRVQTMKHLGRYQQSLGYLSYVPDYSIKRPNAEEPHLFTDSQLTEFFEGVDAGVKNTEIYPHNDLIFPVMFRLIYCCGLRSSEACNLTVNDLDFSRGTLTIFRSKGFKDRMLFISDDISELCRKFHAFYSRIVPNRTYFFQPSPTRDFYTSSVVGKTFDSVLRKTSLSNVPGKKFTTHGLRHLFAVQNIRKCLEAGEDFANWIQYLCKYMGHKTIKDTMYYLHMTSQLFPVYSEKLSLLEERVGVVYVEE
jgi:integrase/recombinase XerD